MSALRVVLHRATLACAVLLGSVQALPAQDVVVRSNHNVVLRSEADTVAILRKGEAAGFKPSVLIGRVVTFRLTLAQMNAFADSMRKWPEIGRDRDGRLMVEWDTEITLPPDTTRLPDGAPMEVAPEWHVVAVHADQAWALGFDGTGVLTAALDGAGGWGHPGVNIAGGWNATAGDTATGYQSDPNCNSHGIHTASSMSGTRASGVGVAPGSGVLLIRVFETSGSCIAYTSSTLRGANYAADRGARLLNVSIGHGTTFVAAAPALTGQARTWLDAIGNVPQNEFNVTGMVSDEFLRYDPAVVAQPITLPKDFWAAGPGFFLYRQSWTDPASTVLAFESGPTSGHGARDANGLMIWKGSFWVSASANIYSASGIEGATENYNNLTVGTSTGSLTTGPGQYLYGGNGGVMATPVVSDTLVVLRGQAKDAYGYQNQWTSTRFVDDDQRTVAYLPMQDALVIVDRVTIRDASKLKTWRWHSKGLPVVSGNTFTLANPAGDQRCIGTVLSPGDVTLGTQSYALGNSVGAVTSYAVTVTTPARASDVVVTVLQCSAQQTVSAVVTATGTTVTLGTRNVAVPLNDLPATVSP